MAKASEEKSNITIDELVKTCGLQSHPEGGYFKETYRAQGRIPAAALPKKFNGDCNYSTDIVQPWLKN